MLRMLIFLGLVFGVVGSAQADPRVFALVVTSNRGTSIAQPPLAYADDDGVRYFQLFRAAAKSPDDVKLLTTFDSATRAAYPNVEVLAHAPVRPELSAAIADLSARVGAARTRGEETAFYFVFAGHGEVREGHGYLGLEDSAIDGYFIEHELIERIPADNKHIVLDSCNSFFVINPRKPGGRRWATPDDMTFGFSARHPEVGVFLSTNAEEEVYEWSKLESGVFSHEVRSGLRGGADVDRNGRVSYSELAGFVARANEGIVRESLRPHLFFRGPQGKVDATLFSVNELRGGRLALDSAQTRAWVADARGERVLDVHKEAGPLTVVLPSEQGELSLYASQGSDPKAHSRAFVLQADDGALTLRDAPIELARGGMFGELFSAPFGPRAFGEFSRRERPDVPEVFGLTEADTVRAGYYMQEIAAASRRSRLRRVACFFALEYAPLGGILAEARHRHRPWVLGVEGGVGAALLGAAFYDLFVPSSGEKMFSSLHGELLKGPDVAREAFLRTEPELIRWQRQLQRRRRILGVLPFALGVTSGVVALAEAESKAAQHSPSVHNVLPVLGVGAIALGAAIGIWQLLVPSAEERLIGMLRRDPQLSMQLGATASNRGGGLALRGAF